MKKEDLKAAITKNFEDNMFAVAMEMNEGLFQEYEKVAGKRSLTSLINYWRKKAEAVEEDAKEVGEPLTTEEIEVPKEEEDAYEFDVNEKEAVLDTKAVEELLESGNASLERYCIIKEEFKQVSDTEQFIQTKMIVQPDGYGWKTYKEVKARLGGKKGVTERKNGSFWKSKMGLPVGEEIKKWTIWKMNEALRNFAFRQNASALTRVTTVL